MLHAVLLLRPDVRLAAAGAGAGAVRAAQSEPHVQQVRAGAVRAGDDRRRGGRRVTAPARHPGREGRARAGPDGRGAVGPLRPPHEDAAPLRAGLRRQFCGGHRRCRTRGRARPAAPGGGRAPGAAGGGRGPQRRRADLRGRRLHGGDATRPPAGAAEHAGRVRRDVGRSSPGRAVRAPSRPDPREAIFTILHRVESGKAFANVLLHRVLTRDPYSAADQALITEVVFGTLRRQGRLDYALQAAVARPLASLPAAIRAILRAGLYQMWFLDRVPNAVAVHEAVEGAKRHGHPGTVKLVNAVLRRLAAEGEPAPPPADIDPAGQLAVTESHPRWLVERWIARWVLNETRALCAVNNTPPPSTLRVNTLRTSPEAVTARLRERGLTVNQGNAPEALRVRGALALRLY